MFVINESIITGHFIGFFSKRKIEHINILESHKKAIREENEELMQISRSERRKFKKKADYKKDEILFESISNSISFINKLEQVGNNKKNLDNNKDFMYLLYFILIYNHELEFIKKHGNIFDKILLSTILRYPYDIIDKTIVKTFVTFSKESKINCEFLDYFDDHGEVLFEKIYLLEDFIKQNYKEKIITRFYINKINENDCNLLLKEVDYRRAIISDEELEKKKKEFSIKFTNKIKSRKNTLEETKINEISNDEINIEKNSLYDSWGEIEKIVYKYIINFQTKELKPKVIDLMSLQEMIDILNNMDSLNTKLISGYVEEYNKMVFEKKKKLIEKNLDNITYLKFIKALLQNNIELKEYIMNFDINNINIESIRNNINQIIGNIEISNNNIKDGSLLIFSSDNFLNEELELINSNSTITNGLMQDLEVLSSINYNELNKKEANFHDLKLNYKSKIKGYRYGSKLSKIAFFNVSVATENQKYLIDKYGKSDVLFIFGLGHILSEQEKNIYYRILSKAYEIEDLVNHIYNIFSNPFTDETRKEAEGYIENGINQYLEKFNSRKK